MLWWLGADRLIFSSDYALWSPKWIIDKFIAFEFPQDILDKRAVSLTLEDKKKILGLNAAKLYELEVPVKVAVPA